MKQADFILRKLIIFLPNNQSIKLLINILFEKLFSSLFKNIDIPVLFVE
jgi:hypothetical protein